jgi:hypothetical protein
MRKPLLSIGFLALAWIGLPAQQTKVPTYDDVINLKRPGAVALSPDGSLVAFTVNETNWDDNAYETEIFLVPAAGGEPIRACVVARRQVAGIWLGSERQAPDLFDLSARR